VLAVWSIDMLIWLVLGVSEPDQESLRASKSPEPQVSIGIMEKLPLVERADSTADTAAASTCAGLLGVVWEKPSGDHTERERTRASGRQLGFFIEKSIA
jgi:hypothetical protein